MSTDVDIETDSDSIRIGHYGIMSGFGPLLQEFYQMELLHPVLTYDVINDLARYCDRFGDAIQKIALLSDEEFIKRFGCYRPTESEWEDRPHGSELTNLLWPLIGERWKVVVG